MIANKNEIMALQQIATPCSLGWFIAAATGEGLCFLALGDDPDDLRAELEQRFAPVRLIEPSPAFRSTVTELAAVIEDPSQTLNIPLDLHGTPFQKQVWRELAAIPAGTTITYKELAQRVGHPAGSRAVANACGSNPVAILLPCHRVIRSDGSLGGYRGGTERKKALLTREQPTPPKEMS